jgi:signal peptide peptidase SppA
VRFAHYSEYFGVWAMWGDSFQTLLEKVRGIDLSAHLQTTAQQVAAEAAAAPSGPLKTADGKTAIIELSGTIMKFRSSFGGASTVRARQQVRAAANDPEVSGILLLLDSPGGTSSGTADLAADVAKAAAVKPTWAYCEDMTCSAAYWIASRADRVFTNRTGMIGCIGSYTVLCDSSRAADREGFTVHIVRAGELKGLGTPGTAITPEQLAEIQKMVNSVNGHFTADVQASRKFSPEQLAAASTGAVWIGEEAKAMGLVDGVQTFEETLSQLRALGLKPTSKRTGGLKMSATIVELKAACPGASADFLVQQAEAGATVESAQRAHMAEQNRLLQAANQAAETARAQAQAAEAKATAAEAKANEKAADGAKAKPGVDPLKTKNAGADDGDGADPIVAFNTAVDAELNSLRHKTRRDAVAAVVKRDPALHQAYLQAFNAARHRPGPK